MIPELKEAVQTLLEAAYQGTDTGLFSDGNKGGILGALEGSDAARASEAPSGDPTVAAHAEHPRWNLANLNGTLKGAAWDSNWGRASSRPDKLASWTGFLKGQKALRRAKNGPSFGEPL